MGNVNVAEPFVIVDIVGLVKVLLVSVAVVSCPTNVSVVEPLLIDGRYKVLELTDVEAWSCGTR